MLIWPYLYCTVKVLFDVPCEMRGHAPGTPTIHGNPMAMDGMPLHGEMRPEMWHHHPGNWYPTTIIHSRSLQIKHTSTVACYRTGLRLRIRKSNTNKKTTRRKSTHNHVFELPKRRLQVNGLVWFEHGDKFAT